MAQQRFKDRLLGFVKEHIKDNDEVVQVPEIAAFLKQKIHEYERRDTNSMQKQVQACLDSIYADLSGLNLQKQFYKKRDLVECPPVVVEEQPVIDNFGEELVDHKSLNLLNNMLPSQVTVLGKRDRDESEPQQQPDTAEDSQLKRQKKEKSGKSYTTFTKEQKAAKEADEMLQKFLVQPKITFADLGGLDPVIKQL